METQTLIPGKTTGCPELHDLINRIATNLKAVISAKKNSIINNVPEEICIRTDEELISSALSNLLNLVITHTENSRIRITAKLFGNVILIHIKDDGCLNYDSISHKLNKVQSIAEKLGGFIGFTSYRNKLTTIAFSFINVAEAA
jgi:K+-sensing histidine kinase KdpD